MPHLFFGPKMSDTIAWSREVRRAHAGLYIVAQVLDFDFQDLDGVTHDVAC
jgi:hypothetical protein